MSHELRTPLNAIIGVSEMLREDAEAAKQDLEPLDRVLGASPVWAGLAATSFGASTILGRTRASRRSN
jgi:signal transduction histidine kinase